MSMEINGKQNYNNYRTGDRNAAEKTSNIESKNEDENGVKTSTVELKTSTPGVTRTAQIKTGFRNVNDYSKYLQEKYSYMNTGKTSMSGIPTTVTVSSAFLKKCMNDTEKAKYLEENLAAIPDCAKRTLTSCFGTVTNQTWSIDANGNITSTTSGTNDPDGKIARENAERKAKEKKAEEEKAAEKKAKKKAEKLQEKKRLEEISISVTGNSAENVTKSILSAISANTGKDIVRFDVKA